MVQQQLLSRLRGIMQVMKFSTPTIFNSLSKIAHWLLSTISPSTLPKLVGAETTASIWKVVTKSYSSLSTTKVMNLHCRLRSMKKVSQSIHEYTMVIKHTCDLLAACGSAISNVEHIATILNGFPIEYEPSIAAITASKESYIVDNIVSILVDAKTRMEETSRFPIGINYTPMLVVSRVDQDHNVNYVNSQARSSTKAQVNTCSCCDHTVNEVVYNPFVSSNDAVQDDGHEEDVQVNSLMMKEGPSSYSKCFPDSGATHHVTSNVASLQNKAPYAGKGKVHLVDGTSLEINHIGTSIINSTTRSLYLDQVLYVPQITKNLLLVTKFARDNSLFFEFHAHHCYVKDSNSKELLLEGKLDGGLYSFNCCSNDGHASILHTTTVKNDGDFWLWHNRLGHPAADVHVKREKSHALPFKTSLTVYHKPFELVEIDVWGSALISSNGYRHFVIFVDIFSRNTWLYLLKNKHEFVNAFEIFVALVKTQFGSTIMSQQTDNGTEFRFLEAQQLNLGLISEIPALTLLSKMGW
ncbi:hypothetical protein GQ457_12G011000 [Hibiscus cannabinus]